MVDETPIKILDKMKKGNSHIGYFGANNDPLGKLVKGRATDWQVFFNYRDNRI